MKFVSGFQPDGCMAAVSQGAAPGFGVAAFQAGWDGLEGEAQKVTFKSAGDRSSPVPTGSDVYYTDAGQARLAQIRFIAFSKMDQVSGMLAFYKRDHSKCKSQLCWPGLTGLFVSLISRQGRDRD